MRTDCRTDPLYVAVIVTAVTAPTGVVGMVKLGEVAEPRAIVMEEGTVTAGVSLLSDTTAPEAGAAAFRVTRFEPVDPPPVTLTGESVRVVSASGFTTSVSVLVTPL